MYRRIFTLVTLSGLLLGACQSNVPLPAAQPTLRVLAVETFLADIAQNVAGSRTKIDSLIPVGADPHAFEPTPQDVAKIADSQVLIINGAGLEGWLQRVLDNTSKQNRLIDASVGLVARTPREGEVAEMSDAELADAMCVAARGQAQAATAGAAAAPSPVPVEVGLFTFQLARQADGSYAGYLNYSTDGTGPFQVAVGGGQLKVTAAGSAAAMTDDRTIALPCADEKISVGHVITLKTGIQYTLALTGYAAPQATLLIGPAGGQEHHEVDPHFWLDPVNVISYVQNIRDGLSQADPAGADVYARNADAYIMQLKDLDTWIAQQVQPLLPEQRLMVTNHESFGYFADRYGFRIIGTIVPSVSTDASPSAQQLARLVDRIKATKARAIFLETGANPQLAQQVAQETGLKVVTGLYDHSVTAAGGAAPTYLAMMQYNVHTIVAALK
jgi:manganese/iron transport system substrate-binding protein